MNLAKYVKPLSALLPRKYDEKHVIIDEYRKSKEKRERKFSPIPFFITIVKLISTDSLDGTQIILNKLFGIDLKDTNPPGKSALSQFRNTIKFEFFKEIYNKSYEKTRDLFPKYKKMRFIGVDGDVYTLPRTS